ncbi:MAG: tetratricopeptide repeat protein [Phycisphaerales bacterium]|nr:MAG: tetratricopeptide repeat protein [Phycisphaerales bacterium]
MVMIAVLALAVRLAYLWEIQSIPFFGHPIGDAASYTAWAERIAGGDWMGSEAFYQAPAYPYFVAVTRLAFGASPWAIRIVQCVLGATACVAVAVSGWWLLGRGAGMAAGVILALYAPAIFFDGLVQKASLGLWLMALLLVVLAWIVRVAQAEPPQETRRTLGALGGSGESGQPKTPALARLCLHWLGAGVLLGLLALTRENALLLLVPVLVWVWVRKGEGGVGVRLLWSVAFAGGMAIALLPVGLRNHRVGGEFAITTVQAGPNFYIGNNKSATGRYVPMRRGHESPPFERAEAEAIASEALGRVLAPGEASDYWWSQSFDFIRNHPGRWLTLLGTKWLLVWNVYEVPDTESYYLYCAWSPVLGVLGTMFHFGVLCPLAAIGVVLTWPRRRELWLLYVLILTVAVGVAVFYVVARYRYPLVPLLALFAGAGLARAYAVLRGRSRQSVVAPLGVGLCCAIIVNWPINPARQLNAMAYMNVGAVLAQQGKLDAAIKFFDLALEGAPESAELHYNLGVALASKERYEDAVRHYRTALEIEPGLMHADYNLGVAFEALCRVDEAVEHYRRALTVDPEDAGARGALQRLSPGSVRE